MTPTPSPSSPLDSNPEVEARMLAAQAWCTKANAHKEMDSELANAVAEIFAPHVKRNRMLSSQIDDLANFIMREIPGEPSQSQGAVDTAIRLLRAYRAPTTQQGADPGQPAAGLAEAEAILASQPGVELYFAGLRHSADAPPVGYQAEYAVNCKGEKSFQARTLGEAIHQAFLHACPGAALSAPSQGLAPAVCPTCWHPTYERPPVPAAPPPSKKGGPEAPEMADTLEKIQAENECRYVSASRRYPGEAQLEGAFPPSVLRRIAAALEAAPASVRPSEAEPSPNPSQILTPKKETP